MENIRERKKALRKSIAARVKQLPDSYRAAASESIKEQVLASDEYRTARRVFLYIGMPTEPDTAAIIEQALIDGKDVYVPKCVSKTEMLAVRIKSTDDLAPGAYGIPEPVDCSETICASDPRSFAPGRTCRPFARRARVLCSSGWTRM